VLERILFFVGVAVQLGGVALTVKGAREVWSDVASPDDRFLAPFIHGGRWVVRKVRCLFRRPATQVIGAASADGIGLFGSARVYSNDGPLPDGLSVDERIALLDDRLRQAVTKVYTSMHEIQDTLQGEIEKAKAAQGEAIRAVDARAEEERQRVVNGVRIEAYGFILLTIGTLIQAGGSYLGID
jgi:hypothetical protein